MKANGMEKIASVVKANNNNKELINKVANDLLNKGLNKSLAKRVFVNSNRLYDLNKNVELICFVEALYRATRNQSIAPNNIFNQDELNTYEQIVQTKQIPYFPKNSNLSEYDVAKLEFLNERYGNRNTKQHYYYLYLAHIKEEELYLQRDLCEFSVYEIVDVMESVIGSMATRNNTLSFITKYLDYCVDRGIIENNVLEDSNFKHLTSNLVDRSNEQMENNYIHFKELKDELLWLEQDDENNIGDMDIMIALLLRNGISSKEIVGLKNQDFDFEKNTVTIKGERGIRRVKLDDTTMEWVKRSKENDGVIPNTRFILKSLDDHIIKLSGDTYNEEQALASIRRRLAKFKQVGFRPLNENTLITSKKIDLLDGIAKKNGILTTNDFKKVQVYFGNSEASYFKLKTEYELVRGIANIDKSTIRKSRQ